MKICPICNRPYNKDIKVCALDGAKLRDEPNIGDAYLVKPAITHMRKRDILYVFNFIVTAGLITLLVYEVYFWLRNGYCINLPLKEILNKFNVNTSWLEYPESWRGFFMLVRWLIRKFPLWAAFLMVRLATYFLSRYAEKIKPSQ